MLLDDINHYLKEFIEIFDESLISLTLEIDFWQHVLIYIFSYTDFKKIFLINFRKEYFKSNLKNICLDMAK